MEFPFTRFIETNLFNTKYRIEKISSKKKKGLLCPERGAKKAPVKEEAKTSSNDIINIFKDRTDPEIKEDIKEYPLWLAELIMPRFTPEGMIAMWMNNKTPHLHPTGKDYLRMMNMLKRRKIQNRNLYSAIRNRPFDNPYEDPDQDQKKLYTRPYAEDSDEEAKAQEEQEEEEDEDDEEGEKKGPARQQRDEDEEDAAPAAGAKAGAGGKAAAGGKGPAAGGAKAAGGKAASGGAAGGKPAAGGAGAKPGAGGADKKKK